MKRKLLYLFLFLSGTSLFAQKQEKKTLLYSIKGPGIETAYLFGTTHLIADSAFYFPKKLEKILAGTEALVLEIDNLGDRSTQELVELDAGSAFDIFTAEQADSVINWGAKQLKMSPEAFRKGFERKKPFVLLQVGVQTAMKGPVKMYELELMGRARMNKQPILGLETAAYQLSLFDTIADSTIAAMILAPIRDTASSDKWGEELTRLYMQQDVEGLSALILESDEIGGNAETLIFQRNRNWIPVMERMMKEHSCFFAVGAGHLGGKNGVIQLLKNAGYTITPVYY